MGILVGNMLHGKQRANLIEILEDCLVCLGCRHTCKAASGLFGHAPMRIDRHKDRQLRVMVVADLIVINTMSRGSMDAPGAAVQRDMAPKNDKGLPVKERMRCFYALQLCAFKGCNDFIVGFSGNAHGVLIKC